MLFRSVGTSGAGLLPGKSAYFPYFWDIQVGDDGALLVREYPESGDITEAPQIWTGFTFDGAPIGRLLVDRVASAAGRVKIVEIGSDGVSVRFEAENGQVEYKLVPWARIRAN